MARIQTLYQGLGDDWIEINSSTDSIRVKGFVGHPKMSRTGRSYQFFFVNQRPVRSPVLSYALEAAFHSLVPEGRHPVLFIFLELDPSGLDINVHPSKREIRFHKSQWVQDELREAVRKALSSYYSNSYSVSASGKEIWTDRVKDSIHSYFQSQSEKSGSPYPEVFPPPQKISVDRPSFLDVNLPSFQILGCFDDLYWVIQLKDGLAFIDQHAAHERVLYERYLRDWRQRKLEIQALLLPVNFDLSKEDMSFLKEHQELLKNLGFGIEDFGVSSILISQVPAYCETHLLKELVLDILDDLKTLRKTASVGEARLEERVILRAWKSAVKAHDTMTSDEIQRLIRDLFSSELPYTCPHGRPTLVKFTESELAKMFKRQ
jgi:DNA mismatch repair protein MutL